MKRSSKTTTKIPTWSPYLIWPTVREFIRLKSTDSECLLNRWTLSWAQGILSECGMANGCGTIVPSDSAICQRSGLNQLLGFQFLNLTSPWLLQCSWCVSTFNVRSSRTNSPVCGITNSLQATLPLRKTEITTSSGITTWERQHGSVPPSQLSLFCQSVSAGCHSLMCWASVLDDTA